MDGLYRRPHFHGMCLPLQWAWHRGVDQFCPDKEAAPSTPAASAEVVRGGQGMLEPLAIH